MKKKCVKILTSIFCSVALIGTPVAFAESVPTFEEVVYTADFVGDYAFWSTLNQAQIKSRVLYTTVYPDGTAVVPTSISFFNGRGMIISHVSNTNYGGLPDYFNITFFNSLPSRSREIVGVKIDMVASVMGGDTDTISDVNISLGGMYSIDDSFVLTGTTATVPQTKTYTLHAEYSSPDAISFNSDDTGALVSINVQGPSGLYVQSFKVTYVLEKSAGDLIGGEVYSSVPDDPAEGEVEQITSGYMDDATTGVNTAVGNMGALITNFSSSIGAVRILLNKVFALGDVNGSGSPFQMILYFIIALTVFSALFGITGVIAGRISAGSRAKKPGKKAGKGD